MKNKKYVVFLIIIFISNSYAVENPMILNNNFNSPLAKTCLTNNFIFELVPSYKYYKEFDTNKYKNKSIGFIIDDLKDKFKLLESETYSGWENLREGDDLYRSHFSFLFKMDDFNAIKLQGCFPNFIKTDNDSLALEHLMQQDKFIIEALQINFKERFKQLKEISINDNSEELLLSISYCIKYFPKACE